MPGAPNILLAPGAAGFQLPLRPSFKNLHHRHARSPLPSARSARPMAAVVFLSIAPIQMAKPGVPLGAIHSRRLLFAEIHNRDAGCFPARRALFLQAVTGKKCKRIKPALLYQNRPSSHKAPPAMQPACKALAARQRALCFACIGKGREGPCTKFAAKAGIRNSMPAGGKGCYSSAWPFSQIW